MKTKPKYTIAVTGLNAIDSPGPGFAVIRSLKEAESFDVRIIGLSYETLEPLIYLKEYVDKTYQMPMPSAGQEVLLERLNYINDLENINFLFPNFDAELFNYIKLQGTIAENFGIKMLLPTMEQFNARQKVNLNEYGEKYKLTVPSASSIFNPGEIGPIAEKMGYPLIVKGKFYDAKVAYNLDQATQHFNKISSQWGLPIILQEFVHGSEVNVCGVGDGKGKLIGAVPMRKLYITDKGKAWAGVSLDDEELIKITEKMVKNTNWQGPFELEFIKTYQDEKPIYHLIEINPRFPAWCYLTTGCGQNQVESAVNLVLNKKCNYYKTYEVGQMFIRYSFDQIVSMKSFETISTLGEF